MKSAEPNKVELDDEMYIQVEDFIEEKLEKSKAEMKARSEANQSRVENAKRILNWALFSIFSLLMLAVVTAGSFAYQIFTDPSNRYIQRYYKECRVPQTHGVIVEGVRSYRSEGIAYRGFAMYDTNTMEEETRIKPTPELTTVMYISGDSWKSEKIINSPRGLFKLPEAERYVFVQGDNTVSVTYQEFCR